jgi:uncharacterized coiled-coil DUF342 family protein
MHTMAKGLPASPRRKQTAATLRRQVKSWERKRDELAERCQRQIDECNGMIRVLNQAIAEIDGAKQQSLFPGDGERN